MKKQIGKRVLTVTLTFVLAAVALFSFTGCTQKLYTDGDFVYYRVPKLFYYDIVVVGLSEEGKTKEIVEIPSSNKDSYEIVSLKAKGIDQSKYWKSENLKKVFIPVDGNDKIDERLFDGCPNLEKVILYRSHDTKTKISNKNNPDLKVYVSGKNYDEEIYHGSNLYKTSGEGYADIYFANVTFLGGEEKNDWYHFINDCEPGGKIDYPIPLPTKFSFWGVRSRCWAVTQDGDLLEWRFDKSLLPEVEDGRYSEFKIHPSAIDPMAIY